VLGGELSGANQADRNASLLTAQTQGRYRSAQTEQALADAAKNQAEARKFDQASELDRQIAALGTDALSDANAGLLIGAGRGADFDKYQSGRLSGQDYDLKARIADPATQALDRFYAGTALKGEPVARQQALGTGNMVDMATGEVGTTTLGQSLIDENAAQAARARAEAANPSAFRSQSSTSGLTPEEIARQRAAGTGQGKLDAGFRAYTNQTREMRTNLNATRNVVASLTANKDAWKAVGLAQPLSKVPGFAASDVAAKIKELKSKITFDAYRQLRQSSGSPGPMTEQEWVQLYNSVTALDQSMSVGGFFKELANIEEILDVTDEKVLASFKTLYPDQEPPEPILTKGRRAAKTATPAAAPTQSDEDLVNEFMGGK
jgi:hypothetical protein